MSQYVVFDVETPNRSNSRICAIGITTIKDGAITGDWFSLVNPEQDFDDFNTQLTGISAADVAEAPVFSELWPSIEPVLGNGILVTHNAAFDLNVLKKCLESYGIVWKRYVRYICTMQMGKRIHPRMGHRLDELCAFYGIELDHHKAGSDSHACAELILKMQTIANAMQYTRTYSLVG